jgi:phosphoserine phosphatase
MTTLLLLRHGEVPGISPPKFRGRQELELTDRGQAQARRTAERVRAGWPQIAAIYCSPRHRTIATAEAVGKEFGLAPQLLPEFDDFDYGTWQGLDNAQAEHKSPELWALWHTAPEYVAFPNGESLPDVAARVARGLNRLRDETASHNGAIVLVAHDSTNRVLLMQLLGMPLRFYRTLAQDPCCLNVIESLGPAPQVRLINSTEHLRDM